MPIVSESRLQTAPLVEARRWQPALQPELVDKMSNFRQKNNQVTLETDVSLSTVGVELEATCVFYF